VIVGIIRRKPVLTYASIIFGDMLASVNSVNSVKRYHEGTQSAAGLVIQLGFAFTGWCLGYRLVLSLVVGLVFRVRV